MTKITNLRIGQMESAANFEPWLSHCGDDDNLTIWSTVKRHDSQAFVHNIYRSSLSWHSNTTGPRVEALGNFSICAISLHKPVLGPWFTIRNWRMTDSIWRHHLSRCGVWEESSKSCSHQAQCTVRRWSQKSVCAPIATVCLVPLSYDIVSCWTGAFMRLKVSCHCCAGRKLC